MRLLASSLQLLRYYATTLLRYYYYIIIITITYHYIHLSTIELAPTLDPPKTSDAHSSHHTPLGKRQT